MKLSINLPAEVAMQPALPIFVRVQIQEPHPSAFVHRNLTLDPVLQLKHPEESQKVDANSCEVGNGLSDVPPVVSESDCVKENPVRSHYKGHLFDKLLERVLHFEVIHGVHGACCLANRLLQMFPLFLNLWVFGAGQVGHLHDIRNSLRILPIVTKLTDGCLHVLGELYGLSATLRLFVMLSSRTSRPQIRWALSCLTSQMYSSFPMRRGRKGESLISWFIFFISSLTGKVDRSEVKAAAAMSSFSVWKLNLMWQRSSERLAWSGKKVTNSSPGSRVTLYF